MDEEAMRSLTLIPSNDPQSASFPQFSRFPLEIRLLIWDFANYRIDGSDIVRILWDTEKRVPWVDVPLPPLLATCSESRQEALKRYRPMFAKPPKQPRIYFDPMTDVADFGFGYWGKYLKTINLSLSDEDFHNVRRIMIDEYDFRYNLSSTLQSFTRLQELRIRCFASSVIPPEELDCMSTPAGNFLREKVEDQGSKRVWAMVQCMTQDGSVGICRSHAWMHIWNQLRESGKIKRWSTLTRCFGLTESHPEEDSNNASLRRAPSRSPSPIAPLVDFEPTRWVD